MQQVATTASALLALLAFINPETTPKIAWDRDDLAIPLIEKVKTAIAGRDGSQFVCISFNNNEEDLQYQFHKCTEAVSEVLKNISEISKPYETT